MDEKRKSIESQEGDPKAQRKTQAELYSDEVKVRLVFPPDLNAGFISNP
jgi:hypothetical protein